MSKKTLEDIKNYQKEPKVKMELKYLAIVSAIRVDSSLYTFEEKTKIAEAFLLENPQPTASNDKAVAMTSALFAKQEEWAFVRTNPIPELFKFARQAGFTQESFDKCLTDQKLLDGVTATRDRGNKVLGVRSTPTFFINGKKLADRADQIESFDKAIEPLLKK